MVVLLDKAELIAAAGIFPDIFIVWSIDCKGA
jgi:hypothetical protein